MTADSSRRGQQRAAGPSDNEEGVGHELPHVYFPDRPDLFKEVEWGSLPGQKDTQKAYKLWSTQDSCLGDENIRLRSYPRAKSTEHLNNPRTCLARNVYENILHSDLFPSPQPVKENAQYRYIPQTDRYEPLRYWQIFHLNNPSRDASPELPSSPILINGYNVLTDRFWTKKRLQAQLRSRNLDPNGLVRDLRQRLHDSEQLSRENLLPREDLSHWGISRNNDFTIRISAEAELKPMDIYTWAIILSPYNPTYWTSRAYLHYEKGYFDLAIGDAYRAQILCEVLINPQLRNRQPGLYIRIWDALEKHILQIPTTNVNRAGAVELLRGSDGVNCFIPTICTVIHHIISLSLLSLHCWSDYEAVERPLAERPVEDDRATQEIRERWARVKPLVKPLVETNQQYQKSNSDEYFFETNYGHVILRDYPYSAQDVDRTIDVFKKRITEHFVGRSQVVNSMPKIAVDKDTEGNLGVYAVTDIEVGEIVYVDEPSIRGHLHNFMPNEQVEHRCENCKRQIEADTPVLAGQALGTNQQVSRKALCSCSKLSSTPLFWCPLPSDEDERSSSSPTRMVTRSQTAATKRQRTDAESPDSEPVAPPTKKLRSCLEIARSLYHYHACGKDWTWLHDSMRPRRCFPYTNESHGTLLSLLLREVFDITLHRRKVDKRPALLAHEIDELLPLFAGKANDNFPFSFSANVRVPFDILISLGVDIFRDLTFDTWVIQSVLRKLVPNVIPWDAHRRGPLDHPEGQTIKLARSSMHGTTGQLEPTLRDLYIFPGVAMFNHFCNDAHNVIWDWDSSVPNRIIIWARKNIPKDAELVLSYASRQLSHQNAFRLFQSRCNCPKCIENTSNDSTPSYPGNYDHPSHPRTPSGSGSVHSGGGINQSSGQNSDQGRASTSPSVQDDQDDTDRPENPIRQINVDENYDESTSSGSTEIPRDP